MEWSNVRQLTWCRVLDEEGDGANHTFVYGADGIRCQKNNIYYTRDGERILIEHNADTGRSLEQLIHDVASTKVMEYILKLDFIQNINSIFVFIDKVVI